MEVLLFGFITAWVANTKGRNVGGWFVFGMLLFIVALPIILCLPKLEPKDELAIPHREPSKERAQLGGTDRGW